MGHTVFKIELLSDGIIYVERLSKESEQLLESGFRRVSELAKQLRSEGKPVLILNHAHGVEVSPHVLTALLHFDFDKLAVYGTPERVNNVRELMVRANNLEHKINSFETKEEALAWLRVS